MSTYSKVVEEILSIPKFTKEKHDFSVLREYLARLGSPEKGKRVIHVAGTNGKGSVTRLLSGLLQNAGRRVGSFYSPHLVRMNERIRVAGEEISDESMVTCYEAVKKAEKDLPRLTFFEILFVMAMVHFDRENVQDIILETGLGGRLDATTAVPADLYVITQIGLDHEEYLGHTIREVAGEKAGIITGSSPVIYHTGSDEADRVIEEKAHAMGVTELRNCRKDLVSIQCIDISGIDFYVRNAYHNYYSFHLPTPAAYQVANAVTVIEAAEVLFSEDRTGERNIETLLRKTFQEFSWEGRLSELFPDFYLDGAHNPAAAEELVRSLSLLFSVDHEFSDDQEKYDLKNAGSEQGKTVHEVQKNDPDKKKRLIYAASRDKNVEGVLRILSRIRWDELWLVSYTGDRSIDTEALEQMIQEIFPEETAVSAFSSVNEVMLRFGKEADIFTLATGSLYLVGEIKAAREVSNKENSNKENSNKENSNKENSNKENSNRETLI